MTLDVATKLAKDNYKINNQSIVLGILRQMIFISFDELKSSLRCMRFLEIDGTNMWLPLSDN